jgi:hypothetical protein
VLAQHVQDVLDAQRKVSEKTVHQQLVVAGRAWLERRCSVVISEMASQREEPDVIGWRRDGSILIECKSSRADYRADQDKMSRAVSESSMGRRRYYLVPKGLLTVAEVYPGWGLLEWNGYHVHIVLDTFGRSVYGWQSEIRLLISALRRVGSHVQDGDGCAVWSYKYQTKKTAVLGTDQTINGEENDTV